MRNYICERCGAHLDPGEKCMCRGSERKYAIIDTLRDGDWFEDFFDTEEDAILAADKEWESLEGMDKARRSSYYVAEVEVDDVGIIKNECRIVKTFKAWR